MEIWQIGFVPEQLLSNLLYAKSLSNVQIIRLFAIVVSKIFPSFKGFLV